MWDVSVVVLTFLLGVVYLLLLIHMVIGWKSTNNFSKNPVLKKGCDRSVTILIAVRNEGTYIESCIQSIIANQYASPFEIIIIDDHSDDNTIDVVQKLLSDHVKLVKLPDNLAGKKSAVTYGVSLAKYDFILCTDGDSCVNNGWITGHAQALDSGCNMVTGIVVPTFQSSLLSKFQFLDFVATMCITANGIYRRTYFMANGANMSFLKSFFIEVAGFDGNQGIASGDDMFLMQKASSLNKEKVGFLKSLDTIVTTKSESTWKALAEQRKRWATKSMKVGDNKVTAIQGFVFCYCFVIILLLLVGLYYSKCLWLGLVLLFWKLVVDGWFLYTLTKHYGKQGIMKSFLPLSGIYLIHILYSGWSALMPTEYVWKSRLRSDFTLLSSQQFPEKKIDR